MRSRRSSELYYAGPAVRGCIAVLSAVAGAAVGISGAAQGIGLSSRQAKRRERARHSHAFVACAVAGLVTLGLCLVGVGAAVASPWSIQSVPLPTIPAGRVSALSCASTRACTAVGFTYNRRTTGIAPMAERWTGKRWSIQRPHNPAGANFSVLRDVSCPSSHSCIAVGAACALSSCVDTDYRDRPSRRGDGPDVPRTLVERWNGSRWSIERTPPEGQALFGVSCPSKRFCMAVGPRGVELRTRNTWTIQRTPRLGELFDVSCTTATACTAVGLHRRGFITLTRAASWNGREWVVERTPSPTINPGDQLDSLFAVSCTSLTACTAVGLENDDFSNTENLVERWNGRRWSIQRTPRAGLGAGLDDVSCTSETACTAVGFGSDEDNIDTWRERWDGRRWSLRQRHESVTDQSERPLGAVSCTSPNVCTVIASFALQTEPLPLSTPVHVMRAERWNGRHWSIDRMPSPRGPQPGALTGVSCLSPVGCNAVGHYSPIRDAGLDVMLAEHWNGTRWRRRRLPAPPGAYASQLTAVSCAAATACSAVGSFVTRNGEKALAERWNGRRSSMLPTKKRSKLTDVSCTSATWCLAVGSSSKSQFDTRLLAEVWIGTTSTITYPPSPPGVLGNELSSVSCTSSEACTAVGSFTPRADESIRTLAEFWNGTSWSIQNTPNLPRLDPTDTQPIDDQLTGVSCTAITRCTAVGFFWAAADRTQTLAETWDGTSWTLQKTPASGDKQALTGVSCSGATRCTAVGTSTTPMGNSTHPITDVWNGARWREQRLPRRSAGLSIQLSDVSCPTGRNCEAVGSLAGSDIDPHHPLAMRHR